MPKKGKEYLIARVSADDWRIHSIKRMKGRLPPVAAGFTDVEVPADYKPAAGDVWSPEWEMRDVRAR